jgi:hypothetical protein
LKQQGERNLPRTNTCPFHVARCMHTCSLILRKEINYHCIAPSHPQPRTILSPFSLMALLLQILFFFFSISALSSSEDLQNERNITDNSSAEVCQGNCNIVYSSPPPPYQSLPIYGAPPPPSSGQGSQPQCPPCCQYAPPQPYYYPPLPYLTPPQPGYQPYYNYSSTTRSVLYDGLLLGLCFLLLGAFV